jgi:hypothetical protein
MRVLRARHTKLALTGGTALHLRITLHGSSLPNKKAPVLGGFCYLRVDLLTARTQAVINRR